MSLNKRIAYWNQFVSKRFKSTFKSSIRGTVLFVLLFSVAQCTVLVPKLLRLEKNIDLKKEKGTILEYKNVPKGMYDKPFIIPFSEYLSEMSDKKVNVDAVNSYTVGGYRPIGGCKNSLKYSHMLDPKCKLVNSWWGVYLIYDDAEGRGSKFMLKDPSGSKEDLSNLNPDGIQTVPMLDQKLITWSSHEGQKDYTWKDFENDFVFQLIGSLNSSYFRDLKMREWLQLSGEFKTVAALTDTKKTDMHYLSSIRAYVGLPDEDVYKQVDPWYPFVLKGEVLTRYFPCKKNPFWALVYYNGSKLDTKDGVKVDTWPQVEAEFKKSVLSLKLECGE
ncbi:hypothetical protein AB3N59_15130 [Leptospira sp. WS92.C1]